MQDEDSKQISSFTKIKYLNHILKPKEKVVLFVAIVILVLLFIGGSIRYYLSSTTTVPAKGGEYTEGVPVDSAGIPTNVNPILAEARPIDETISSLIYSSLFQYDSNGQLKPNLADKYENKDGKEYVIHLKKDVVWHDGKPLTAQDIVFTVNLLQDPYYNPITSKEWDKEKITVSNPDDYTIVFKLSEAYAPFLSKLTFGVLPKHLWINIPKDNFALTELNLKPVGSGPFIFDELKKNTNGDIVSYKLIANNNYYNEKPYLERLIFNFYRNKEAVIDAYNKKEISGFNLSEYSKANDFKNRKDTDVHTMAIPQYFSVLLNQGESIPLADERVRQALRLGTNRDEFIKQIFYGYADKIYSPLIKPFIPEDFHYDDNLIKYDPEEAKKLLDKAGWKKSEKSDYRRKDNEELKIKLVVAKTADLLKTAEIIKNQWKNIGVNIEIVESDNQLDIRQKYLEPRKFESLISGVQYSGNDPNLFFFWHSSGKKAPGLNFTLYDNEKVDKLLKESKEAKSLKEKNEKYIEVSKQLIQDSPAIFLYTPKYLYVTNKKIKGINTQAIVKTSNHLKNINTWYIKTKRIKK